MVRQIVDLEKLAEAQAAADDDLVQLLSYRGKARVDEYRDSEEHNAGKCFHQLLVLANR